MREIKFRAWDESKEVMHHDFQYVDSGTEGNDWILFISDKQVTDPAWHKNPYFRQQLKVMQFTGLKDKNGAEIYEGDILQYTGSQEGFTDDYWQRYEVKIPNIFYSDQHLSDVIDTDLEKEFEVIGNRYQNKELIAKQEDRSKLSV